MRDKLPLRRKYNTHFNTYSVLYLSTPFQTSEANKVLLVRSYHDLPSPNLPFSPICRTYFLSPEALCVSAPSYTVYFSYPPNCTVNRGMTVLQLLIPFLDRKISLNKTKFDEVIWQILHFNLI